MLTPTFARAIVAASVAAFCFAAGPAAAQDEVALRNFFEGRRVTLKMDMPGTSDGVDLQADSNRPIDYGEYGNRLKRFGTAIHAGGTAPITLIKVKKDLIEFQLGGGGYGTFRDDTSTSVNIPYVEKSEHERELERKIKDEDDRRRRRDMERELDDLRERRERENRRIDAEREEAEARKALLLAERRLAGGSRFNLRYNGTVPSGIRPAEVMAALAPYVDFSSLGFSDPNAPPMPPPMTAGGGMAGGDETTPHKGMIRQEAERLFGRPVQISERREGSVTITTLVFDRGDERITADFIEGVIVRYIIASK